MLSGTIGDHARIELRTHTEITALEGNDHLEGVQWRDNQARKAETHNIGHVFSMTGAIPNSHWLDGCVAVDPQGFIKTGSDLSPEELVAAH